MLGKDVKVKLSEVEDVIRGTVKEVVLASLGDARDALAKARNVSDLQEQINKLEVDKSRREEDIARKERELEHKVGLERTRQAQEIELAKRESSVEIREENLKVDRVRFEEQLQFHEDRFSTEVGYLKDMVTQVLERIPHVEVDIIKNGHKEPEEKAAK